MRALRPRGLLTGGGGGEAVADQAVGAGARTLPRILLPQEADRLVAALLFRTTLAQDGSTIISLRLARSIPISLAISFTSFGVSVIGRTPWIPHPMKGSVALAHQFE
jgi:hypothetical protein